ncbi:protein-glutamine gamma-glutamyltransferase K-like isoform X3 [Megalobrama amblycephala]|uniref:protein-glutamine gamma-glutamyltransferase K-like isoform X3 n=1 Tax=Megalobrama amblycephala TaxID=75352 RepID=UPI002013EEFA|nr:protein-glutamine gamma-glutamyltransferase K-like isoform X3 [Megalobrama amblycephala]
MPDNNCLIREMKREKESLEVKLMERNHKLNGEPLDGAVVGKELTVKMMFQNPLSQVLRNVLFRIEGLGMQSVRKIPYGDVEKLATVTLMEKFVPTVSGSQKLLASMDCRQLTQTG